MSSFGDISSKAGLMSSFGDIHNPMGALLSSIDDMVLRSADELGPLVRDRRNELGLSQQALADLAGVHRTYIIMIEQGKRAKKLDTVLMILHTLGMDLEVRVRGQ
ncbi:MAG: helix-turn-helix domain-containing protein [Solirubrobacteraceae bacterium]